ncbi:MAG: ribonuclease HII [Bacilli bacterium]
MKKENLENNIDLLKYERELYNQGITLIAGTDEVGRGPLVGPVVAAAVILPVNYNLPGLNDSKKLTEKKREKLFDIIMKEAISVGIGVVDAKKIDEINILEASRLAMQIAIEKLAVKPEYVLSDAMKLDKVGIPYKDIIHGDALSLSIAAASVIAKVTRDRMMIELDKEYPMYGFARHKGYPTKEHIANIQKYGILDNYRFTYKPVSNILINNEGGKIDKKGVLQ